MPVPRPSLSIPEQEKRGMSEAEVRAKLFARDMQPLGHPSGTSTQADSS